MAPPPTRSQRFLVMPPLTSPSSPWPSPFAAAGARLPFFEPRRRLEGACFSTSDSPGECECGPSSSLYGGECSRSEWSDVPAPAVREEAAGSPWAIGA